MFYFVFLFSDNILINKNNLFIHDLDKKKGLKLIEDGAVWSSNLEELSQKSDVINLEGHH